MSFAVRSNALRHMRTNHVDVAPPAIIGEVSAMKRRGGSDAEIEYIPRFYQFEPPVVNLGVGQSLDLFLELQIYTDL